MLVQTTQKNSLPINNPTRQNIHLFPRLDDVSSGVYNKSHMCAEGARRPRHELFSSRCQRLFIVRTLALFPISYRLSFRRGYRLKRPASARYLYFKTGLFLDAGTLCIMYRCGMSDDVNIFEKYEFM